MDVNTRFQEEILAQLAGIIDRQVLQMVEAAVGSVLRNYEVTRRETALSTNIVEFPELDLFLGRMRYRNCAAGTIKQYSDYGISGLCWQASSRDHGYRYPELFG